MADERDDERHRDSDNSSAAATEELTLDGFGGEQGKVNAQLLEKAFLGEPAQLTREKVEEAANLPVEQIRRLWRALGFADAMPDEPMFTQSDLAALRLAARLQEDKLIGPDAAEAVARVMGQTMSRLAEAQTDILTEQMLGDEDLGDRLQDEPQQAVQQVLDRTQHLLPDLEWLLGYVWRRHALAAAQRAVGGASPVDDSSPLAIGFCDIVGYTSLVREMPVPDLASLVSSFESTGSDIVISGGGRVVKTIGDEIMFLVDDAHRAAEIALQLAETFCAEDNPVPSVRVGLAWGPALGYGGDFFGPVVNLASRCTTIAKPGSVVCDREMAQRLEDAEGLRVSRMRMFRVRGYGHLHPYAIRRAKG